MRTWRWYSKLLFALLVGAFAYLVWPTPWRYLSWHEMPVRVHRLTGRAERLEHDGWREVKQSPKPAPAVSWTPEQFPSLMSPTEVAEQARRQMMARRREILSQAGPGALERIDAEEAEIRRLRNLSPAEWEREMAQRRADEKQARQKTPGE